MFPDRNSPDLVLVQPTKREFIAQYTANGAEWRAALSIEAYLRREEWLSETAICRNAGTTYWALVDRHAKPDERNVLAACETLRKRALISRKGMVVEGVCHGVGSVFTPVENRGHGYGARMMEELGPLLGTWQADPKAPVNFSVLFSDIGKKFYAKKGWKPFASSHIALPAKTREAITNGTANGHTNGHANGHTNGNSNGNVNGTSKPTARPLYDQDLPQLCKLDEAMIRTRLAANRDQTSIVLLPDVQTFAWHHAREEFVAREILPERPTVRGAMAELNGRRVWAVFTRVWQNADSITNVKGNVLHVLRLVVERGLDDNVAEDSDVRAAITAIFELAQEEAGKWYCEHVEVWNPSSVTVKAAQTLDPDAKVIDRENDSITSLRWYDEQDGEVVWLENEKYGWC